MVVEREAIRRVSSKQNPALVRIQQSTAEIMSPVVQHWVETIANATQIHYQDEFPTGYIEAIKEGYLPFIVTSHSSHFDALAASTLTRDLMNFANEVLPLTKQIKGFEMPLSKTLSNGKQGLGLKGMYEAAKPFLEKNKLFTVNTVTPNDVKRGEHFGISSQREFLGGIEEGLNQGYALLVFADGTIQAGRKDENGQRYGMQQFKDGSITTYYELAQRTGHSKVLFIPVAISGGFKVMDPELKRPPLKTLFKGFGLGNPKIVDIRIGTPIRSDNEFLVPLLNAHTKDGRKEIEDYFGKTVAQMLPPEERGQTYS